MSEQDQPSTQLSSVMNDLRLEGKFTDAVIKVGNVHFPVHKIILCNCIPYFRALFTRWDNSKHEVFEIPDICPDTMELILNYAYTGFLTITESNVQQLLVAADLLNAMEIVKVCCDYLMEVMCPSNCIGIWKFTNICFHDNLRSKAFCYILEHFEQIVLCDEFSQLTVEELKHIIKKDNLIVRHESSVYEAVLRWIAAAPEDREEFFSALFSEVRQAQLSKEYIRNNIRPNDLVTRHQLNTTGIHSSSSRPRLPSAIILAIGGWSGGDPTNGIEAYNIRADSWIRLTNNHERPRAYHGTVFLNGYVYCVGGFDRVEHFNSVCRFNPITHIWQEVAPMYCRRCYVSVTVLNGCIYALGGYDGISRLNTAEYYQPEINQWSYISSMHEERSDASCTTFQNKVYICGGFNGHNCLQTAEYYSPETNSWTMISPMISQRSGIGVIAYAGHVYAVGGFDGNNRLRTAEAYSPVTDTWTNVASMITPRSNFGIEVIEDRILVAGGFNGFTTTFNVECYDAATNVWSEAKDMEIFRSALSCCVISGLPNMAEYAVSSDTLPLFLEEEELDVINS